MNLRRIRPEYWLFLASILWGTSWIPVRQIAAGGWDGGMATVAGCTLAAVALLPFALRDWRRAIAPGARVYVAAFLIAIGITFYFEGMARGYVARVVLLFYLMPIWSVLFGRIVNGDPITVPRMLGVAMGLGGMLVVFWDGGIPLPESLADGMALAGGVSWALAFALLARPGMQEKTFGLLFTTMIMLPPQLYLLALLPGPRAEAMALTGGGSMAMAAWLAAFAFLWLLPAILLSLYGASRLHAAQAALLFMMEVVIAISSAALLIDEPFGLREMLGATLIVGASLLELASGAARTDGSQPSG